MRPDPKELAHWEEILRKEGLSMSRGRRIIKQARTLREDDIKSCTNCCGYHTLEGDCAFRPQA